MSIKKHLERSIILLAFGFLLYRSCVEFYAIGSGTGEWYADFSMTWYLLFWVMVVLCIGLLVLFGAALWFPERLKHPRLLLQNLRERSNLFRWCAGLLFLALPLFIFQFTVAGVVLGGYYIRLLIVTLCMVAFAFLFTRSDTDFITWKSFFVSVFLFSAIITITARFTDVLNYPFSLGWSEGNRLWDYSTLFGRDRYIYPTDAPLTPYLDFGRQLIGGLAFLWPGLTIAGARFWVDFTTVFPYL
jgi:MFS family permease